MLYVLIYTTAQDQEARIYVSQLFQDGHPGSPRS